MGMCQSCFNRNENRFEMKEFCLSLCCCFSINDDKSQTGEPNERTTLLGNPVSNNHNYNRPFSSGDMYHTSLPGNNVGDEQSALNRILQQTASDIIDVSAIPTHLERKEFMDRVKLYEQKLHSVQKPFPTRDGILILKDSAHPEKIMSESPLTYADFKMIGDTFSDVQKCLQDIKVQPNTDLVARLGTS